MSKFCVNCGASLVDEAKFCSSCGAKQEAAPAPQPVAQPAPQPAPQPVEPATQPVYVQPVPAPVAAPIRKEPKKPLKIAGFLSFLKPIMVSALAVLMFIFAFLPLGKQPLDFQGVDVPVKVSALDNVSFLFSAIQSKDVEDLEEDYEAIMEDMVDEMEKYDLEDLVDDDGELTAKGENVYGKFAKKMYKLQLKTEDSKATASIIFKGILSLAYLAFAITAFIFAVLKLLAHLNILKGDKSYAKVYSFMFLTLSLLIALVSFSKLGASEDAKAGSGAVLSFVFFGIVFAAVTAINVIEGMRVKTSNIILSAVSAVLAILVISFAFAPAFSLEAKAHFGGKSKKATATTTFEQTFYEDNFTGFTEEELEAMDEGREALKEMKKKQLTAYFKAYFEGASESLEYVTVKEFEKGEANAEAEVIISEFFLMNSSIGGLFAIVPIIYLLGALGAAAVLGEIFSKFMTGKMNEKSFKSGKILAACLVGLAFLVNTIFVLVMNGMVGDYTKDFSIGIVFGQIFCLITAIALACIPVKNEELPVITQ